MVASSSGTGLSESGWVLEALNPMTTPLTDQGRTHHLGTSWPLPPVGRSKDAVMPHEKSGPGFGQSCFVPETGKLLLHHLNLQHRVPFTYFT